MRTETGTTEMHWFELIPEKKPKGWKPRMGMYGIDTQKRIWIPISNVGNSTEVFLCASVDGTPVCRGIGGDWFVTMDWAIDGFRRNRDEELAVVREKLKGLHPEVFGAP